MKRPANLLLDGASGLPTPGHKTLLHSVLNLPTFKKSKQSLITKFLDHTPLLDALKEKDDVGTSGTTKHSAQQAWPTTAQRKLEKFGITDTPVAGLAEAKPGQLDRLCDQNHVVLAAKDPEGTGRSCEDDDEDDFFLSMSQTYERPCSQQVHDGCFSPLGYPEAAKDSPAFGPSTSNAIVSQHASLTRFAPAHLSSQAVATQGATQASTHKALEQEDITLTLPAASQHDAPATTPELPSVSEPRSDGTTPNDITQQGFHEAQPQMFNIFRPVADRKFLIVVRHAESEYNAAARQKADPWIFDPHITATGLRQCEKLRDALLQNIQKHGEALWVISPLRRAIQTFLNACPLQDRLEGPGAITHPLNIVFNSSMSEFVGSTGDIGRPKSVLQEEFKMFAQHLEHLQEQWWYAPEAPNCALSKQFNKREPQVSRVSRLAAFERWLSARPEKFVICIGHGLFLKEFTKHKVLANCEMLVRYW